MSNIHTSIRQYQISQLWSGKYDDYNHILNQSRIIGATVYTNISQFPRDSIFDICIVDEAGHAEAKDYDPDAYWDRVFSFINKNIDN